MSSPEAEPRRLFFALWPDAALRQRLYRAGRMAAAASGGKLMAAENLHITLSFLGTIPADKRSCIEKHADSLRLPPFELVLDQAGYWPRPRVVWLGCNSVPPSLLVLAGQINAGLPACGLTPETRPYAPHLTVMRKARCGPAAGGINPIPWAVRDFVLVQSLTLPQGAQYQVVRRWPLAGQL